MKRLFQMSLLALLLAPAAYAIQGDQIRGEITAVDADQRILEVQISEVGYGLEAEVGATESYHVPESVPIEYEIEKTAYRTPGVFDFADIRAGDRVLLDFDDIDNPTAVTRIRNQDPQDATIRERVLAAGEPVEQSGSQAAADAPAEADPEMRDSDRWLASNESQGQRSALPESASPIPMLALFGLALAGFAFALRLARS